MAGNIDSQNFCNFAISVYLSTSQSDIADQASLPPRVYEDLIGIVVRSAVHKILATYGDALQQFGGTVFVHRDHVINLSEEFSQQPDFIVGYASKSIGSKTQPLLLLLANSTRKSNFGNTTGNIVGIRKQQIVAKLNNNKTTNELNYPKLKAIPVPYSVLSWYFGTAYVDSLIEGWPVGWEDNPENNLWRVLEQHFTGDLKGETFQFPPANNGEMQLRDVYLRLEKSIQIILEAEAVLVSEPRKVQSEKFGGQSRAPSGGAQRQRTPSAGTNRPGPPRSASSGNVKRSWLQGFPGGISSFAEFQTAYDKQIRTLEGRVPAAAEKASAWLTYKDESNVDSGQQASRNRSQSIASAAGKRRLPDWFSEMPTNLKDYSDFQTKYDDFILHTEKRKSSAAERATAWHKYKDKHNF